MDNLLTSYSAAIDALFARTTSGTKFGLERTETILASMGSPHRKLSAIHVAGTNGKGSVVASADALLRARGLKVGRYTSPHLIDFRERITVNSAPIPEEAVLDFLERWTPLAEEIGATFFELTTALAFEWFATQEVDIAVIETGLGGRLDSTNVLTPLVATVTSIGMDHTDLLGDTLEKIAREKAGIFKPDVPAVIGESNHTIRSLLEECARAAGAQPVVALEGTYFLKNVELTSEGTSFDLSNVGESKTGRMRVATPLLGFHQARNTAVAIATLNALDPNLIPPPDKISAALSTVFLPGRFQRFGKFIFDVAHNPDGAGTVARTLVALDPPRPRTAIVAVLADKDWQGIIRALAPAVDRFVFTDAPSAPPERRWRADEAKIFADSERIVATLETDLDAALRLAEENSATVVVTGSFHTVGDVMSRLQVSPFAA
ncbi:MAG: bifunctional folylpolyglutamate synthase/dihydrofolate synthase [Gemmatimonadaceae bacterium]